ncbi:hypothetical protein Dimus_018404 [Dionaea muscipula]
MDPRGRLLLPLVLSAVLWSPLVKLEMLEQLVLLSLVLQHQLKHQRTDRPIQIPPELQLHQPQLPNQNHSELLLLMNLFSWSFNLIIPSSILPSTNPPYSILSCQLAHAFKEKEASGRCLPKYGARRLNSSTTKRGPPPTNLSVFPLGNPDYKDEISETNVVAGSRKTLADDIEALEFALVKDDNIQKEVADVTRICHDECVRTKGISCRKVVSPYRKLSGGMNLHSIGEVNSDEVLKVAAVIGSACRFASSMPRRRRRLPLGIAHRRCRRPPDRITPNQPSNLRRTCSIALPELCPSISANLLRPFAGRASPSALAASIRTLPAVQCEGSPASLLAERRPPRLCFPCVAKTIEGEDESKREREG